MTDAKTKAAIKYIADNYDKITVQMITEYCDFIGLPPVGFRHSLESEIRDARVSDLGLSTDKMLEFALGLKKLGWTSLARAMSSKLSTSQKEKHPEIAEDAVAAPAPGTSFTSTANVARYPVPLGMVRRAYPKKGKKRSK